MQVLLGLLGVAPENPLPAICLKDYQEGRGHPQKNREAACRPPGPRRASRPVLHKFHVYRASARIPSKGGWMPAEAESGENKPSNLGLLGRRDAPSQDMSLPARSPPAPPPSVGVLRNPNPINATP